MLRECPSGVAFGFPGKPGEAHAATQRAPIARSERAGPGAMVARLHKRQRSKLSKWVPVRSNRAKLAEAHQRRPDEETNAAATTCHTGCGEVIAIASTKLMAPVPKAEVARGMYIPPATMVHVLRSLRIHTWMWANEEWSMVHPTPGSDPNHPRYDRKRAVRRSSVPLRRRESKRCLSKPCTVWVCHPI